MLFRSKEKRFSNSEVDLWSKEAENPIRYAKRMGANLKEPKKSTIIRKKGQLLSNSLKNVGAHGLSR